MDLDTIRVLKWNASLCGIVCVVAAILGRLSRKGNRYRFLKASGFATLAPWTLYIEGLGVGFFPSAYLFWHLASDAVQGRVYPESFTFLSLIIVSWLLVFCSFWFFSRQYSFIGKKLT